MPIPRRFDRRPPDRDDTRINERIRVPEVRLIGDDGNQVGVISRDDALRYAQERDEGRVAVRRHREGDQGAVAPLEFARRAAEEIARRG